MADIQYSGDHSSGAYSYDDGYDYGYEQAPAAAPMDASRVTQLVNWAGALVSMGLVIGMGVWAFQLMVRDVADVPVIRALDGPMRVAPDNPGGSIAENQGLAVNRLAEGAEAAPVPDQLLLAPPPQDLAAAEIGATEEPEEQAFENASSALPDIDAEVVPEVVPEESTDALIARLLQEATPLSDMDAPAVEEPDAAEIEIVSRAAVIPVSTPGVRRSPRPAFRPAGLSARAAVLTPTPAVAGVIEDDEGFEIATSELDPGTRLVQLGAFDSPALARSEWERLTGNFPDFFLGRARVIEEATSGGQTFYRLRAHGFADLSASRRFCAALVAQGAACIPVTVR
ncbi:SPOR domain-containing protein [Gymnodinialimonas ceratoperidinii]|uniref:SPOR domain-containing protein n=1 Tax=Gymnodinialimonas ceratoperidinii TaxID=2856823 RepID=A0A8F6TUL3_9RHOB|nr:SPOR domain-containing protein [Gymnodinialimonas ceratoperidinii]QXT38970.1 SPOR domain-containing protein [Gymnodinialimonas ceratoperidinii]